MDLIMTPDPLKRVREDFRVFLALAWKTLGLPAPDPIQMDMAHYLQHGPQHKIINAYRGCGKSYITSAFIVWCLWNDKDRKFLVISATEAFAANMVRFQKSLLEAMPICQHMIPNDDKHRWTAFQWDVKGVEPSPSPSVRAASITGQITGSRADTIIADDIEIPKNSATQLQREKLAELVKEMDNIITPKPDSTIIYLGTPHNEDSLYNRLEAREYDRRVWPARFPTPEKMEHYGATLAVAIREALAEDPSLAGKPTEPRRFPEMYLQKKELRLGRATFALQFMLDTRLSDLERYPLKVRDLIIMGLDPKSCPELVAWASGAKQVISDLPNVAMAGDRFHAPMETKGLVEYQGTVMSIDPSGRGADETAYAVVRARNSQLFLAAAGGVPGGYEKASLEALAKLAKKYGVNKIVVEANFGDGMFTELMKPVLRQHHACSIEEVKATNRMNKEARILDVLEPVIQGHQLIVDPQVIRDDFESTRRYSQEKATQYSLIYQMTRLTREKGALIHDDRIDALAWAVHYWTTAMGLDVEEEMQAEEERRFDEYLQAWEDGLSPDFSSVYDPPTSDRWFTR